MRKFLGISEYDIAMVFWWWSQLVPLFCFLTVVVAILEVLMELIFYHT